MYIGTSYVQTNSMDFFSLVWNCAICDYRDTCNGVQTGVTTDEFNWLSVISAVVGAIGAVGGIVVGMISLITLSQIDKQVKIIST